MGQFEQHVVAGGSLGSLYRQLLEIPQTALPGTRPLRWLPVQLWPGAYASQLVVRPLHHVHVARPQQQAHTCAPASPATQQTWLLNGLQL